MDFFTATRNQYLRGLWTSDIKCPIVADRATQEIGQRSLQQQTLAEICEPWLVLEIKCVNSLLEKGGYLGGLQRNGADQDARSSATTVQGPLAYFT